MSSFTKKSQSIVDRLESLDYQVSLFNKLMDDSSTTKIITATNQHLEEKKLLKQSFDDCKYQLSNCSTILASIDERTSSLKVDNLIKQMHDIIEYTSFSDAKSYSSIPDSYQFSNSSLDLPQHHLNSSPRTPTLEQLGLSAGTMRVLGGKSFHSDSSDYEFNSFQHQQKHQNQPPSFHNCNSSDLEYCSDNRSSLPSIQCIIINALFITYI